MKATEEPVLEAGRKAEPPLRTGGSSITAETKALEKKGLRAKPRRLLLLDCLRTHEADVAAALPRA